MRCLFFPVRSADLHDIRVTCMAARAAHRRAIGDRLCKSLQEGLLLVEPLPRNTDSTSVCALVPAMAAAVGLAATAGTTVQAETKGSKTSIRFWDSL